jgi:hypothetical protein
MALRLVLVWIGITVGGLLLLALIDVARAVVRRFMGLRSRRVGKTPLHPEAGSSPTRAR